MRQRGALNAIYYRRKVAYLHTKIVFKYFFTCGIFTSALIIIFNCELIIERQHKFERRVFHISKHPVQLKDNALQNKISYFCTTCHFGCMKLEHSFANKKWIDRKLKIVKPQRMTFRLVSNIFHIRIYCCATAKPFI